MSNSAHALKFWRLLAVTLCFLANLLHGQGTQGAIGIFQSSQDIGAPARPGAVVDDANSASYKISGGGANMWFANDQFHFVWKKISGDCALSAEISFEGTGGDPHRKAFLMIRQSLDSDSAYADAALHGDGLTSLQYREAKGAMTREIQSNIKGPQKLRIERRGSYVSMSVAPSGSSLQPAGGSFRLDLTEPFYIGMGVCAHAEKALETANFRNVTLSTNIPPPAKPILISTLETIVLASKDRRAAWWTRDLIEAPNWLGTNLIFNSKGRIYSIPAWGGEPKAIDTGFAIRCNNDHGISPNGSTLVISDQSQADRKSRIYTLPIAGGSPKLITEKGPSYWHGWSPDGKTLAYCAEREGEFDIYTIPADGGLEKRLTTAKGLDDGPDYSPDGKYIYFNSDRTGLMHIWRMNADGADQVQVTKDEANNWFPHPSPDGKSLAFLTYDASVKGHPANKDVSLKVLTLANGKVEVIAKLFGGQGTINVPSWSPDSRRLAFVSYQFEFPLPLQPEPR